MVVLNKDQVLHKPVLHEIMFNPSRLSFNCSSPDIPNNFVQWCLEASEEGWDWPNTNRPAIGIA